MQTTLPNGDPSALGFDPERLSRIPAEMQKFLDQKKAPNLVTLVARRGQIVHLDSRGVLDMDGDVPVDKSTLYRLWSNTKPIAGVAAMLLFEDGIMNPDDPITRWIPEWGNRMVVNPDQPGVLVPASRDITIRDCFTNTTGIASPATAPMGWKTQYQDTLEKLGWLDSPAPRSTAEVVRLGAELPLVYQPGEGFSYHVGYPLLTACLEAACGTNLDSFFRERIFEPLKMHNSGFYLGSDDLERFPAQYVPRNVDGSMQLVCNEKASESEKHLGDGTYHGAGGDAGGVLSTIEDYARFGQMLLNGGELDGVRILGRKSVDLMVANHFGDRVSPQSGPGFSWGLGVVTYHGRNTHPLIRSVGTYGWSGMAGTTYFADPSEELMGICFSQVVAHRMMPGPSYQETFQRLVYQSLV